jgi:N-acetylmuramoyl-L-alanine amidase
VPAPVKPKTRYVVVVDPGHGGELSGTEPIGPWAGAEQKVKTQSGAEGEAEIVLAVGLKLRPLLEAQGVKVIMTRTAPKALSNIDRAQMANKAHADLFLRLHCDGIGDSSVRGISMQLPNASKGWAPIGASRKAGDMILSALVNETGAPDRGLDPRPDLTGFNWSKVPTCLPEMGFVSNPSENAKLHSAAYQQTLAKALADGTMAYLHSVR